MIVRHLVYFLPVGFHLVLVLHAVRKVGDQECHPKQCYTPKSNEVVEGLEECNSV